MLIPKYQDLWKAIIRPPRDIYNEKDLGPKSFVVGPPGCRQVYMRDDFTLENHRNAKIKCTHYKICSMLRCRSASPCVIYLHGNCSSRREAVDCLRTLYPLDVSIMCFDFSGCGLSEGEYVSLGWHERDDLDVVVSHLRNDPSVSTIGLWGRSMGAVTALLHGDRDPSIACMVLDSPFSSMRSLCEELAYSWKMPRFIVSLVMRKLRKTVREKADFCIDDLEPIKHVDSTFIPSLFIAGAEDTFIQPHHSDKLHEKYAGDKDLIMVEGDHNSARPAEVQEKVKEFFELRLLHMAGLLAPSVPAAPAPSMRRTPALPAHAEMPLPVEEGSSSTSSATPFRASSSTARSSRSSQQHVLHPTHFSDMRPPERSSVFDLANQEYLNEQLPPGLILDHDLLRELQISPEVYMENIAIMEQLEEAARPPES